MGKNNIKIQVNLWKKTNISNKVSNSRIEVTATVMMLISLLLLLLLLLLLFIFTAIIIVSVNSYVIYSLMVSRANNDIVSY